MNFIGRSELLRAFLKGVQMDNGLCLYMVMPPSASSESTAVPHPKPG